VIDRRALLGAGAACAAGLAIRPAVARPRPELWTFDSLSRIAALRPRVEGSPRIVQTPFGKATEFDGVDDALFLDRHPLAGAARFTFEALFRPDGGAFEQRWFHLESDEGPQVKPGTGSSRMLFQNRVVEDEWYLDAFMKGAGYSQVLMVPERRFRLGAWYHVAQTYDGATYRSYVDGQLQAEAKVPFQAQGPGRASVGIRMNHVNPFKGAIRQASFVRDEALGPGGFVIQPRQTLERG
jgi:hypothetical protein